MTASEGFHKKGGVDGAYVRQERLQDNKKSQRSNSKETLRKFEKEFGRGKIIMLIKATKMLLPE